MDECLICQRIGMIKNNINKYFVKELETGYIVIGDHQFFKGYILYFCVRSMLQSYIFWMKYIGRNFYMN